MRHYELVIIFDPKITEQSETGTRLDDTRSDIAGIITSKGGKVHRYEPWGKLKEKQAYPIKDSSNKSSNFCYYILMNFECGKNELEELKKRLRFNGFVLRYLITKQDSSPAEGEESLFKKGSARVNSRERKHAGSSRANSAPVN